MKNPLVKNPLFIMTLKEIETMIDRLLQRLSGVEYEDLTDNEKVMFSIVKPYGLLRINNIGEIRKWDE